MRKKDKNIFILNDLHYVSFFISNIYSVVFKGRLFTGRFSCPLQPCIPCKAEPIRGSWSADKFKAQ